MLMPKKVKYRKVQRGRMKGKAWRGSIHLVRRIWAEGDGLRVDYVAPDRSGSYRDDAFHQARRQSVDPVVPG